ncbi:MAG: hypothetical protein MRY79_06000 [Alphaproteobacteria bacterium]|nr:hypothetical protein [Alphaproteobacteria bacterium]
MRIFFLFFAVFILLPQFSSAKEKKAGALISGAYLYELCKRNEEGGEDTPGGHAACQSYIAGLVDYHNLLQSLNIPPSVDLCVPATANLNDLQDIVWRYLERNAQHDAFIAAPAVSLALFEVFPCKKKK